MTKISNAEFGGERPLYHMKDIDLENVTIHLGESSVKECTNVRAEKCTFEGKYALWCCDGAYVKDCIFRETSRSSVWHSKDIEMVDTLVEAPKMFREMDGVRLTNVKMPLAQETFWDCSDIEIDGLEADNADYIFFHCSNIRIRNFKLNGNYSFQHAKNVEIWDSDLQSKDSLWESENVTVYNSFINGEYLAWHSKNLRLVNCRIGGTQPLCYAENLVLENCTFEPDADLAFEYSDVKATVVNTIPSVKNPRSGFIKAAGYGEVIIDENIKAPADATISTI